MKLYVGNLPFRTTSEDLAAAFRRFGEVQSAQVLMDRDTGRSRGFGFVEMSTAEEATKAVEMFHNKEFQGRQLTVNVARPREERPPRSGGGGGYRGDRGEGRR